MPVTLLSWAFQANGVRIQVWIQVAFSQHKFISRWLRTVLSSNILLILKLFDLWRKQIIFEHLILICINLFIIYQYIRYINLLLFELPELIIVLRSKWRLHLALLVTSFIAWHLATLRRIPPVNTMAGHNRLFCPPRLDNNFGVTYLEIVIACKFSHALLAEC